MPYGLMSLIETTENYTRWLQEHLGNKNISRRLTYGVCELVGWHGNI